MHVERDAIEMLSTDVLYATDVSDAMLMHVQFVYE